MALRQVRMPSDYRPGRLAQGSTTRAGVSSVRLNCVDTVLTSTSIVDLRIRCSRSLSLPVPYLCVSRVVLNLKRSRACVSKTLASWADEYGTGSDSDRSQFRICVSRVVLNLKRSRACLSKTLASWADEYGTGSAIGPASVPTVSI